MAGEVGHPAFAGTDALLALGGLQLVLWPADRRSRFEAVTTFLDWSMKLVEGGLPLVGIVTGTGISPRGGMSWVSAEYSIGGKRIESAGYVSPSTRISCRIGNQIPIRVLRESPRFWMAEAEVNGARCPTVLCARQPAFRSRPPVRRGRIGA